MDHRSAIDTAKKLPMPDEKLYYIIVSGVYCIFKRELQEARKIAEYVANEIGDDSSEARKMLMETDMFG